MSNRKTVRLGKSALQVTPIGFGGIPIQRISEEQAVRVVRAALDGGINWIDTANAYGTSEECIGKAIGGYDRSRLLLFTKGAARDPETLSRQIELSLERLQTGYLDLFQFHNLPDPGKWREMHDNGTVALAREYRVKGLIRHIGASAHTRDAALALAGDPLIEVLQYPFNIIVEQEGLEIIEACRRREVGFIAMKPFGGGVLANAALCIGFLLQYPDLATDPGFEKVEEVEEVLAVWRRSAPLGRAELRTIERLRRELGTRFCRRCGYCSPCPHGVDIITLMTMDSLIKRFHLSNPENGWIAEAGASAERCVECGECQEKCPYRLPIIEGIRQGAELLAEARRPS